MYWDFSVFCARMAFQVGFHELLDADAGVALGGGEGRVTEEFLDGADVGAVVEKVGGEGVAQDVGADAAAHADLANSSVQSSGDAPGGQPPPAVVDEQSSLPRSLLT